jgi:hypothetical protein
MYPTPAVGHALYAMYVLPRLSLKKDSSPGPSPFGPLAYHGASTDCLTQGPRGPAHNA